MSRALIPAAWGFVVVRFVKIGGGGGVGCYKWSVEMDVVKDTSGLEGKFSLRERVVYS